MNTLLIFIIINIDFTFTVQIAHIIIYINLSTDAVLTFVNSKTSRFECNWELVVLTGLIAIIRGDHPSAAY